MVAPELQRSRVKATRFGVVPSPGQEELLNSSIQSPPTVCSGEFYDEVLAGLSGEQKSLPCKYFYDQRGSELFDQICELPEYYPTRTEQAIMDRYAPQMADQIGEGVRLVEFGSGSSTKTRVLLRNLIRPAAYVPLDISEEHLLGTAEGLRAQFPDLEILPLVADFTKPFTLPDSTLPAEHTAVYFPGSTIGNFRREEAADLLKQIAEVVGLQGGLLIGVDLQKDASIIEPAYDDAQGVTAAFNLNLLHRINEELDGQFDLDQFEHLSFYNPEVGRIEIYIVSTCDQTVRVCDREFTFAKGERIHTEYSHKYSIDGFTKLASAAGFSVQNCWTDEDDLFAVMRLRRDA